MLRGKNTVRIIGSLAIILSAVLFLMGPAFAKPGPRVWYVPCAELPTIQAALSSDEVKAGDTIILKASDAPYTGEGFVNLDFAGKAVTLKSQSGPAKGVIDGGGVARAFYFHSGETAQTVVSGLTLTNCGGDMGGAIAIEASDTEQPSPSSPTIMDCIIVNNTATAQGAAVSIVGSSPTFVNCLIASNTTPEGDTSSVLLGSAIYCSAASPTLTNCTIAGNANAEGNGSVYCANGSAPVITNTILYGNTVPEIVISSLEGEAPSVPDVTYSFVPGYEGDTNIVDLLTSPAFIGEGDYRLAEGSPCINVGNNEAPAIQAKDLDGYLRIVDEVVDLGAYEYNPYALNVDFSATPVQGAAPLEVTFTDLSAGDGITAWEWNFGDGTEVSTEQNPIHTYSYRARPYTVTLTVTGSWGAKSVTKKNHIKAHKAAPAPVADFDVKGIKGKAPFKVKFINKSKNAFKYSWDFGDETKSKVRNPVHLFRSPGSFDVTLTVTGKNGVTDSVTKTIIVTPPDFKADFTAAHRFGRAPLKVKFMAKVHKEIATYVWDFGDDTDRGEGKTVNHVYTAPGKYDVTLTVTGTDGAVVSVTKKSCVVVRAKGRK
jgi:PKD repeat protein